MSRIRVFTVLAMAVGAGGALAYGTYNYLQNVPVRTVAIPTRPVVVAAADLSLGTELGADDLKVVQWPDASVPEGAFARAADLQGRGLVAAVVKHEPILPAKLAPQGAGAGLPPAIPNGMRAVSVRVNEVIGVAGYVLPGGHVDVVATASPTDQHGDMTSKVVLANVQVLTAGTKLEQDQGGKPMQVTVVTLLVSPDQAERLALASTEGKIQLALRNPLDLSAPETTGVRPAVLLGVPVAPKRAPASSSPSKAPQVAAAPPPEPPPATVEMIRGDKRANEIVR